MSILTIHPLYFVKVNLVGSRIASHSKVANVYKMNCLVVYMYTVRNIQYNILILENVSKIFIYHTLRFHTSFRSSRIFAFFMLSSVSDLRNQCLDCLH